MSERDEIEILLVEDNQDDLDLVLRALRKSNPDSRIQIARDGVEAPRFIFGDGPPSGPMVGMGPRVILLDLKLPRIDGPEVLKRIKSDPSTKTIPAVVLTSSKEHKDLIESFRFGVNSYLVKPVGFEAFAAAVRDPGMYWLLLNQPPQVG